MSSHRLVLLTTSLAAVLLMRADAAGPTFVPDAVVQGSSLAGWHAVGAADWRAQDGEVIGVPRSGGGGWLVSDRSYQDVAFYASVECTGGCRTGVLLRAERTPEGMKGVYLSLTEGDAGAFQVTFDEQGREIAKNRLPTYNSWGRLAPPPVETGGSDGRGGGGRGGAPQQALPPGVPQLYTPPSSELQLDVANRIEIFVDANAIRWFVNDGPIAGAALENGASGFGPIALHVGGTGQVRFRDVSYRDLSMKVAPPEELSDRFRMQRLTEFYYSWSAAAADFNRDGVLDIATGPYIYYGPDYTRFSEVFLGHTLNPSSQFPYPPSREFPTVLPDSAWVVHADDFTGDGWPDILTTDHTGGGGNGGALLYVNPRGEPRRWTRHVAIPRVQTEITLMRDVDGDGRPELVYAAEGFVRYAKPDPANPTGPWIVHNVSENGPWGSGHGLGVGDVNGDGRMDIVRPWGWWEQPQTLDGQRPWRYNPVAFGRWDRSVPGGATIAVYDVNGDGLNDIVTSLQAHGQGLAWFEQKRDPGGAISFERHMIMDDWTSENAGGVRFTQLHGATTADVDKDGVLDFIVGKRYWAHLDSYYDPDPYGPAVLYWYRTVRNPRAPGGAEFVPNLVHNRSGVGSDVLARDLNGDGEIDIVTSTNRGTFIFWGRPQGASAAASVSRAR